MESFSLSTFWLIFIKTKLFDLFLQEREPLYAIEENPEDKSTAIGARRV